MVAQEAFTKAARAAIEENDRLGVPSYGSKDGKIIVREPMIRCSWEECPETAKARYENGFAYLADCNGFKTGWYCRAHVQSVIAAGDGDEIDWNEWGRSPGTDQLRAQQQRRR